MSSHYLETISGKLPSEFMLNTILEENFPTQSLKQRFTKNFDFFEAKYYLMKNFFCNVGLQSIRAYGLQEKFIEQSYDKIDLHSATQYIIIVCSRYTYRVNS